MTPSNLFTYHRSQTRIAALVAMIGFLSGLLPTAQAQQAAKSAAARAELALQIGHRDSIYSVALSRDGKTAASASYDGTLKLWDTQTGDLRDTFALPDWPKTDYQPREIAFSANGKTIEFHRLRFQELSDDTKHFECNLETKELRFFPINKVSVCPDKADLVASVPDGRISVCRQSVITEANTDGLMPPAEFFLWEHQTKQKAPITKEYQWFISPAFDFSPDGRLLAIYSGGYDPNVVFWDVTTRQVKRQLQNVFFRGFSADGKTIVLDVAPANRCNCPEDNKLPLSDKAEFGAVELWDRQLEAPKRTLIGREFFGYTPDGQTILLTKTAWSPASVTMELWDAQLGKLKQKLIGNLPSFSLPRYSPDGQIMALLNETNLTKQIGLEKIILYDLRAGKIINHLPTGPTSSVDMITFSKDGTTLTTVNRGGEAKLWDAHTGALKSALKLNQQKAMKSPDDLPKARFSVQETAFSADGQLVIVGTQEGIVGILDFRTGRVTQTLKLQQG